MGQAVGVDRQLDGEAGAGPELAVQVHPAAHGLGELADDGEAEAGALVLAADRAVELLEALEHPLVLLRRDPGPVSRTDRRMR
nr:hypothetical protein [Nannocystis pusilla]